MSKNGLTFLENARGMKLVAKTYKIFEKLAKEQIAKSDELSDGDLDDVIIGVLVTKLLVTEGKLDEKFFESAIS